MMSDESKANLLKALKDFIMAIGLPGVICGIFLYMGNDERIMESKRMDNLQIWAQEKLITALDKSTEVIAESARMKEQLAMAVRENSAVVSKVDDSLDSLHDKIDKLVK